MVQFTPSHRSCVISTRPPSTATGVLVGGSHFWVLTGGGATIPEPRPTIGLRTSGAVLRARPERGRPTPHMTDVPSPFHWFASTLSWPWPPGFQETGTQKVKPDARTWRHSESGDPTPGTEQLCDCRLPPGRHKTRSTMAPWKMSLRRSLSALIGFAAPGASPRRVPTHHPSAGRAIPRGNAPGTSHPSSRSESR